MGVAKDSAYRSMKRLWKHYAYQCRKRELLWMIPLDLFHKLTSQNCVYCDKPPMQIYRTHYKYNGLDRLDPKRGYEVDNVAPCCGECNGIKSNRLTFEETRAVAQALKRHRKHRAVSESD